jgi:histidine ammonia-lyase
MKHPIDTLYAVAIGEKKMSLSEQSQKKIQHSFALFNQISTTTLVYGLNTGFGPMAHHKIALKDQRNLQYNLVRSHACGMGTSLPPLLVRAIMYARALSLSQGHSAVSPGVVEKLIEYLDRDIIPHIPRHGSVGASGDLVQLAHIALSLIGEGDVIVDSKIKNTRTTLKRLGVTPTILEGRDGLALINGTSAMTGIAAITLYESKQLLEQVLMNSALLYQLFDVKAEHYAPIVAKVRPHRGQAQVISLLRSLLSGKRNTRPPVSDFFDVQAVYSLRCVPQIIGPIIDTIQNAIEVTETELSSVTDNPIFTSDGKVVHNGNFHGDYIALEMDKVRIALAKLSVLLERQLHLLVNPKLNNNLFPPYLNEGTLGLNLGLQAAQFIATSNTAETIAKAHPVSIHSLTTNNDNQDVVSMGTNSALATYDALDATFEVHTILTQTIIQALKVKNLTPTRQTADYVQKISEFLISTKQDSPLSTHLSSLKRVLKTLPPTKIK